jgi:hypothetical protein
VKRQTITRLAKPSIAESSPNEISAIEPASTPAVIAIAPSAPIQASESQERSRALRAAWCHSRLRAGGKGCKTVRSLAVLTALAALRA